jgi:hypothetical protein
MVKKSLSLLLGLMMSVALAAPVALNPDHPDRYVVVKGDTLWDISGRFLEKPWLWPEIWQVNPQIANPHLIYPGDVLTLVYVDGRPRIQLQRGGTVKLSPEVRGTPLADAVPTIPLDAVRPFLTGARVFTQEELDAAPYIVAADEHVIAGAGDRVYVRANQGVEEQRYDVLRPGAPLRDIEPAVLEAAAGSPSGNSALATGGHGYLAEDGLPVQRGTGDGSPGGGSAVRVAGKGEILGYEAIYVGSAAVERGGDPATATLQSTALEARVGDRLLPVLEEQINQYYLPHPPAPGFEGRIIAAYDGVTQVSPLQVVAINKGASDGLEVGHVLAVWRAGEVVPDPVTPDARDTVRLPDEQLGLLMVFRTFDRVSYALVMRASREIRVYDFLRTPS